MDLSDNDLLDLLLGRKALQDDLERRTMSPVCWHAARNPAIRLASHQKETA